LNALFLIKMEWIRSYFKSFWKGEVADPPADAWLEVEKMYRSIYFRGCVEIEKYGIPEFDGDIEISAEDFANMWELLGEPKMSPDIEEHFSRFENVRHCSGRSDTPPLLAR